VELSSALLACTRLRAVLRRTSSAFPFNIRQINKCNTCTRQGVLAARDGGDRRLLAGKEAKG